jgi:hypothetical protein
MKFKQFRSGGEDIRVESRDGHMGYITNEFVSLPDVLWADAYSKGAIAEDMNVGGLDEFILSKKLEKEEEDKKEREEIKVILKGVFDSPIGYLDSKNNLVTRRVVSLIGKPVKKEIIDSIWEEIVAESEG